MKLFSLEEVNIKRQFEFDMAEAVCILGMVFAHCFENLAILEDVVSTPTYYIIVNVLDSIFGAGTFMICMGLGISYSYKNNPNTLIKRGLTILILGYVLNIARYGPYTLAEYLLVSPMTIKIFFTYLFDCDIMAFVGVALMLFGLLKKLKLSDFNIFLISLAMSIFGSFVRFVDFKNILIDEIFSIFIVSIIIAEAYTRRKEKNNQLSS